MGGVPVFLVLLLVAAAGGQSIQTVNGTMVMQIPGATLTLASASGSIATPTNTFATTAEVAAAQTLAAQAQPQINNAFLMINATNGRLGVLETLTSGLQTSLASGTSAEHVRALGVEGSLAGALTAETNRATLIETALSSATAAVMNNSNNEQQRARTAQSDLSTALVNTQASLAQATNTATALSSALASQTSSLNATTASLSTALARTQLSLAATQSTLSSLPNIVALQQQLAAIANCSARGLLTAMDGTCIVAAGLASGAGSGSSSCTAANSSAFPVCSPGFSPLSTSTSACSGAPTTFTCQAVLCPDFAIGVNVPSGCRCHPDYFGSVTATSVTPFYVSTCSPVFHPCPNTSTGASVYSGCTCKAGYKGNVSLLPAFPFVNSTCTPEPCPANSVGSDLAVGCTCMNGMSGVVIATNTTPFFTSTCAPVWVSPSSLPPLFDLDRSRGVTVTLVATPSPTIALLSGTLPAGAALSAAGVLSGFSAVGVDTTSTFSVRATAGGVSVDRTFTLTVKAPITQAYSYTGADVVFPVPVGLQNVRAVMWGAAGGGASGEGFSDAGGVGGYTEGIITTTSLVGSNLIIQVGAGGFCGATRPATRAYPNGGFQSFNRAGYTNGGGGGRSAIFRGSVAFANAVLVAGGGGGGAGHGGGASGRGSQGGAGGGTVSESGVSSYQTNQVNYATQTQTFNLGVVGTPPQQGGPLAGQDAGDNTPYASSGNNCAGGGGDGYYGGGSGGNGWHEGGGGGSGYFDPAYVVSGSTLANPANSNAPNIPARSPLMTTSPYYATNVGASVVNGAGNNGRVVLIY